MQSFRDLRKKKRGNQVEGPWDEQEFGIFEQQKESECGWDRMSKESGKEKESWITDCLEGHGKNFRFDSIMVRIKITLGPHLQK